MSRKKPKAAEAAPEATSPADTRSSTAAAAARTKEKIEGGGTPGREFRSAALGSGNVQPAGSGGPFDPANTAKASMSEHMMRESQSVGHPTTGGMTPKIGPGSPGMSELQREQLAAAAKPAPVVDAAAERKAMEDARHAEAIEVSKQRTAERNASERTVAPAKAPAKKVAAKAAPAKKAAPVKKAAKKAPAKRRR